jgi:biopolymer transport protein ExbD
MDSPGRRKLIADLSAAVSRLKSIAFAAPYLGLAGTCVGIMDIFRGVGMERHTGLLILAAIFAAALVTTAAGILVVVPATCFYNYLCTRIDLLGGEVFNASIGRRHPLRKRFSELPAFGLIAAPSLAMAVATFMSFASFREPKGLAVEVAPIRCDYEGDNRPIVLRIDNSGRLLLNRKQQNWNTLSSRLAEIDSLSARHILYLSGDDGVPFQTVADAIDIAQDTGVGSIRLMTPNVMNAPCLKSVPNSSLRHPSMAGGRPLSRKVYASLKR